MANFDKIDKARRVLGLGKQATSKQIKSAYRKLAHKYHPDICKKVECQEMMKEINGAFKLITEFCANYHYSFSETSVERVYPFDEYMRRWENNWKF